MKYQAKHARYNTQDYMHRATEGISGIPINFENDGRRSPRNHNKNVPLYTLDHRQPSTSPGAPQHVIIVPSRSQSRSPGWDPLEPVTAKSFSNQAAMNVFQEIPQNPSGPYRNSSEPIPSSTPFNPGKANKSYSVEHQQLFE